MTDSPVLTVTLKPDVAEQVRSLAEGSHLAAETIVDEALRTYLAQAQREKLHAEEQAFEQQHAALLSQYRDEYVALNGGQVIDHDHDLRALHLRVLARLALTPVLLKLVSDQPDRELVVRSPRLERLAPLTC